MVDTNLSSAGPSLLLAALLICAAVGDVRARLIPNRLTLAITLLAPLQWWISGLSLWPTVIAQLLIGLGCLCGFAWLFSKEMMGGGDVKLIAALGLWFPLADMVIFLFRMAMIGGGLTIALLLAEKVRRTDRPIEVPYGVAIALSALSLLCERYVNSLWTMMVTGMD